MPQTIRSSRRTSRRRSSTTRVGHQPFRQRTPDREPTTASAVDLSLLRGRDSNAYRRAPPRSGPDLPSGPVNHAVESVGWRHLAHLGEPRQRECSQGHDHVADRHVEEAGGDEIGGDAEKPRTCHVGAQPSPTDQNGHANRDFDDADQPHEGTGRHRQQPLGDRTEIRAPIGEQIEEFVDSRERRRQTDAEPQRNPGSVESVVHVSLPPPIGAAAAGKVTPAGFVTFCALPTLILEAVNMTGTSSAVVLESAELSDAEVIRHVLQGNTAMFELLMRRYNERLYRAARAIVRDEQEAEDVMQQAYVNAFTHLRQFNGAAQFSTWLTRIAINEALARVRRQSRYEAFDDELPNVEPFMSSNPSENPERQAFTSELRELLEGAIDTLPDGMREVCMLRDVEGLSTEEGTE